ncbi:MAG: ROK family protein [Chloroflexi bacterium]|nr:ROK family protein [Chloroflexota bacterium]
MGYVVGVDLGGTQIRACLADMKGSILCEARQPTLAKEGLQPVLQRMKETIAQVLHGISGIEVLGIGVGSPGPLDPRTGVVIAPPNLPGWRNVPLREILSQEFGLPVYVNNDANVAALAEQRFGAGRGCSDIVYLTISTGIGGGVISSGQLLLGAHGLAGEPGHTTVEPAGPRCNCGNVGCLEMMAAGPAIARHALDLMQQGQHSTLWAVVQGGMELTAEMVGRAAQEGDDVALQAVARAAHYLGIGVLNLIHIFDPDRVILGGGVSKLGSLLFDPVRAWVREHAMTDLQRETPVVPAALGDQVGLLGAVAWAMDRISSL